jgi:hypothetical protein
MDRRARIEEAMGADAPPGRRPPATMALRGTTATGETVCAVATPLYLEFVELLVCRFRADEGVLAAHHDPLRHESEVEAAVIAALAPSDAIELEKAPLRVVIEELAHAVVADRRRGRDAPAALARFADLFGPDLEEDCPAA